MIEGQNKILQAFLGTLMTWGLTAAGAGLVFIFSSKKFQGKRKVLDVSLGFAAGVMVAASFWSLLAPGIEMAKESGIYGTEGQYAFGPVAIGFALGGLFVFLTDLCISKLIKKDDSVATHIIMHSHDKPAERPVESNHADHLNHTNSQDNSSLDFLTTTVTTTTGMTTMTENGAIRTSVNVVPVANGSLSDESFKNSTFESVENTSWDILNTTQQSKAVVDIENMEPVVITANNTESRDVSNHSMNGFVECDLKKRKKTTKKGAKVVLEYDISGLQDNDKKKAEMEEKYQSWKRMILLVVAITVHNIPEGLAVGVGFGAIGRSASSTFASARNLAIGIGIQNFPEGMAVSVPLAAAGYTPMKSFWYGQLSGMVEPIFGILGALIVSVATPLLPYALAFAAGAMIYVVMDDIIPEAHAGGNGRWASWGCMLGFILMMCLDVGLG